MSAPRFRDLMQRVAEGDQDAAVMCVEKYGGYILRAVRRKLRKYRPIVQRECDSIDFVQLVWTDFFERVKDGRITIESEKDLLRFIYAVAERKVLKAVCSLYAQCRDWRRESEVSPEELEEPAFESDPAAAVEAADLLRTVLEKLKPRLRRVVRMRLQGVTWQKLAEMTGTTPDALRLCCSREIRRLQRELEHERE